jgi:phosphatidyl-myo-inositol dimannoside synthase
VRLLYISHSLPPIDRPLANLGGMQRVATELHDELARRADVELSSLVLRASWRWTHVRILPFAGRLLHRVPRLVQRERIDAVLYSSMVTAALALPIGARLRRLGVATAAIPVGRDVTLPFAPYQRLVPRIFRSLDLVFPISLATAAECVERGASTEQVRIVPCGIDPNRFQAPARESARTELAWRIDPDGRLLPPDAKLLFSVGRHVERKGFEWFVERVMPRLPGEVHFWLAGEGPETPAIRAAVARNRLESRVRLLGRVPEDELSTLLAGSDLFVMPNVPVPGDMEGFGVVLLEAGIHGLPIVASALEGISDVVEDGANGVLVPSGDAGAFADAISLQLEDDVGRAALGASAANYTRTQFGWAAIADRYIGHLREVSAERRRAVRESPTSHPLEAV